VDVVDAVSRREAEHLVRGVGLGAPSLPERVEPRVRIGRRPTDEVLNLVREVIVGAWRGRRDQAHRVPVEQVSRM
jgi:hypothetical protein